MLVLSLRPSEHIYSVCANLQKFLQLVAIFSFVELIYMPVSDDIDIKLMEICLSFCLEVEAEQQRSLI